MHFATLLLISNIFMTAAWYAHLRYQSSVLWKAILVSWLLALPEYMLQVPANRLGFENYSIYQLKIMQECITLVVFAIFAFLYFGEKPNLRYMISFALILAAVVVAFGDRR